MGFILTGIKKQLEKWNPDPNGLSFERYMILTCQQVYYEEIYEDISKEGANTKILPWILSGGGMTELLRIAS